MADTSLRITADTTQAERSLAKLSSAFDGLKSQLLGLGLGAAIQQVNAFALELSNAAKASEVSIGTVSSFSKAVGKLGGDAGKASGDVIDFVAGLDAAKKGSASAQIDLAKVGITLSDLGKLSNEDLFKKTVQGIAAIGDSSERNSLAVQMLGRSFKDIDIRDVARTMGGVTVNTAAIESAAAAQRNLNTQFGNLREALLNVIKPLNDIAKSLNVTVTQFENLIKLGALIAGAFVFFKYIIAPITAVALAIGDMGVAAATTGGLLLRLFAPVINIFKDLWGFLRLIGIGIGEFATGAVLAAIGVKGVASATGGLAIALSGVIGFIAKFAGIVGLIYTVAEAFNYVIKILTGFDTLDWVIGKVGELYDKARAYLGLKAKDKPLFLSDEENSNDLARIANRAKAAEQDKKNAAAKQAIIDAQRGQRLEQDKILRGYEQENIMGARTLALQMMSIGLTEDQANRQSKLADVETAWMNKKNDLQTKYTDLQKAAAVGTAEEKAAFAAFAAVFGSTMKGIDKQYQQQLDRVTQIINLEEVAKAKEKDRLTNLELITKQFDRQVSLSDTLRGISDKLVDAKFEDSLMGLDPLQKKIAQIREDNRKGALEAGRAFAAQFDGMDLTTTQAAELTKGLEDIAARYKLVSDTQVANMMKTRTWNQGWKDAFNEYVDNATNAAMAAQNIFKVATQSMEDALVGLAKTGKFAWKDMLATMAEDLLRSQIRQLFASMMGGKSSGGSVILGALSSLGGILGFRANGGPISAGNPYVVGERGPELVIPSSSGTVIPNSALGGGNVTYNINAVDALSFKQMIAKDPGFIHAVATQGGKSIPGTRR